VDVKTPDPGEIYIYDWESIFGRGAPENTKNKNKDRQKNPYQPTNFSSGGQVNYDEITDALLRILRS